MTPLVGLLVLLAIMALAIFVGVPIGWSLFFSSAIVVFFDPGIDLIMMPIIAMENLTSFTLLAVPLFMYAAFLLNEYEITEDIVEVAGILVGRLRGGLAHINIMASVLFGSVSGSSAADAAGIGGLLIPVMAQKGYSRSFAAAVTAASSTIGNIIPPSIMMIVYGAAANVSVGGLFLAGIIPGLLIGASQMITAYGYCKYYNWEPPHPKDSRSLGEKLTIVFKKGAFPISVFVVIIGGIAGGIFTATEAAAVAVVYVASMGLIFYPQARSMRVFMNAAKKAAILAAVTYFAIIGASVFGWLLSYYRAIDLSIAIFDYLQLGPTGFLFVLCGVYLIMGMFLDPIPILIIMTPLMTPIGAQLGLHPMLLGMISIMAIRVGTVTPPFGISMLIASAIARIQPQDMAKDIIIFTSAFMLMVFVCILVPELITYLPDTFGVK